jgi:tRNA(Ile)-lysidine synthase TilS/MesJ
MNKQKEVERSIIKTYRKDIWVKFIHALKDYELINENDKVMVCISGGKDSFLLAKCIQELTKHGQIKFEAKYVVMDPGYKQEHLDKILAMAKSLGVDIEVFKTDIFEVATFLNEESPCYMCARMRRGHLYNKAEELGCNKIALGHHFDDVIETLLLSMFYGAEIKTMLPKLHSTNFQGLELIRPLYYVKESSIKAWAKYNELDFINCACPLLEGCSILDEGKSKRQEIKRLIKKLKEKNKNIENNIFTSTNNVNLNCILGYKKGDKKYSFLDDYE